MKDQVYDFLNKYYTLSIDEKGWIIRDLCGNVIDNQNILDTLPFPLDDFNAISKTFNYWLDEKRKVHLKPLLLILKDYNVIMYRDNWTPIHNKTGKKLNIKEVLGDNYYDYSEPILKQTLLFWISKEIKKM